MARRCDRAYGRGAPGRRFRMGQDRRFRTKGSDEGGVGVMNDRRECRDSRLPGVVGDQLRCWRDEAGKEIPIR